MGKHELLFRVAGEPQGKARPRFTKKGRAYTPKQTKDYEAAVQAAALTAALTQGYQKTEAPVRLHIGAWFAVPKSFSKAKRQAAQNGELYPSVKPDADNIAKAVCDALNDIAYHDDKQIVECVVRKRYCREGEAPHLTVFIEPMPTAGEMKAAALETVQAA